MQDGCQRIVAIWGTVVKEGDKDIDSRSGMMLPCTSFDFWGEGSRLTSGELQDNAGKTTLLYRLKVCRRQIRTKYALADTEDRLEKSLQQYPQ